MLDYMVTKCGACMYNGAEDKGTTILYAAWAYHGPQQDIRRRRCRAQQALQEEEEEEEIVNRDRKKELAMSSGSGSDSGVSNGHGRRLYYHYRRVQRKAIGKNKAGKRD